MSEESGEKVNFGHIKKNLMYQALRSTLGIVSAASDRCGVSRSIHYEWMTSDTEYKKAVDELQEMQMDFVESSLLQQIKNGDNAPTIFYLKTRARSRGYVEQDLSMDGTVPEWLISRIPKPE